MPGPFLSDFRRIVIKIGSALLIDQERRLLSDWLSGLAEDIADLRRAGKQVLIVTSGAVAIGSRILKTHPRRSRLE
jgi:glutamate 5-kinase